MTILIWFWNFSLYFILKLVSIVPSNSKDLILKVNLKVKLENKQKKTSIDSEIKEEEYDSNKKLLTHVTVFTSSVTSTRPPSLQTPWLCTQAFCPPGPVSILLLSDTTFWQVLSPWGHLREAPWWHQVMLSLFTCVSGPSPLSIQLPWTSLLSLAQNHTLQIVFIVLFSPASLLTILCRK